MAIFIWNDKKEWQPDNTLNGGKEIYKYLRENKDKFPTPRYNLYDIVSFVLVKGEVWRGVIRDISYSADIEGTMLYHDEKMIAYWIDYNDNVRLVLEKYVI